MTQAASFKGSLKNAFEVFKWELKNRKSSLIVYFIIAAALTAITFTLCSVLGLSVESVNGLKGAAVIFQLFCGGLVAALTSVFAIIYTAGNYSYLHDKRKLDMYGSLPVGAHTMYVSKTASAFLFSIVPAMFFFGVISILSVCMGQFLVTETIDLFVNTLIGTAACISAYGLLAVCCGTTAQSIISFIVICITYPVCANFIKAMIRAFHSGLPTAMLRKSFIMNALNPLSAFSGSNKLYWLLFTAACVVLGMFLAKKRKAERAQTTFAFFLPCYLVKLIVAFICGMILGTLFGSMNVLANGLAGFIFGFLLGAVPSYVIVHLIFYKNFEKLLKTSIAFGAMTAVVLLSTVLLNADIFGFNTRQPELGDIESAGIVRMSDIVLKGNKSNAQLASEAADDFTDTENIRHVSNIHGRMIGEHKYDTSAEKFKHVWVELFMNDVGEFSFLDDSYCIGYKLKNGSTLTRCYRNYSFENDIDQDNASDMNAIKHTDEYYNNYSVLPQLSSKDISSASVHLYKYSSDDELLPNKLTGKFVIENKSEQADEDIETLIGAMKKDGVTKDRSVSGEVATISIYPNENVGSYGGSSLSELFSALSRMNGYDFYISYSDENTMRALYELGIVNSDKAGNPDSPYYNDPQK